MCGGINRSDVKKYMVYIHIYIYNQEGIKHICTRTFRIASLSIYIRYTYIWHARAYIYIYFEYTLAHTHIEEYVCIIYIYIYKYICIYIYMLGKVAVELKGSMAYGE